MDLFLHIGQIVAAILAVGFWAAADVATAEATPGGAA